MAPGMMCFGKKPVDTESKKNEEIDKQLRVDRKRQEREVKLLLLGMDALLKVSEPEKETDHRYRCRRKWEIDRAEADACNSCRRLQ